MVVVKDVNHHETNLQTEDNFDKEAFVKEFWRILQKQNQKIDNLIEENSNLKSSINQTNQNFLKYKESNNKIIKSIKHKLDANVKQTNFVAQSSLDVWNFVKHQGDETINQDTSLSITQNNIVDNSAYMIKNTDPKPILNISDYEHENENSRNPETRLRKLYRSTKKNSVEGFDTFNRQPFVEVSFHRI